VVICLEQGADLHMAELMPLPLTVSCSSKIQIGFTFLVPAYSGFLEKRPLNGCSCLLPEYLGENTHTRHFLYCSKQPDANWQCFNTTHSAENTNIYNVSASKYTNTFFCWGNRRCRYKYLIRYPSVISIYHKSFQQCPLINYKLFLFASATVTVDSSHMTASSSALWRSRFSPSSNFVNSHFLLSTLLSTVLLISVKNLTV